MIEQRWIELDVSRGLAILLVVVGHALEALGGGGLDPWRGWQVIYAFHMPLFFLLSGAGDRASGGRTLRQVCHGALGLITTAYLLDLAVCAPLVALDRVSVKEVALRLVHAQFYVTPLWFISALALTRVLDALAGLVPSAVVRTSLIGVVLGASYTCAVVELPTWQVRTLFAALPFYLIGRHLDRSELRVSGPVAACGFVAVLWLSPTNLVHIASGHYGTIPVSLATALGGSCLVLATARMLKASALAAALAGLGRRSFGLFVTNGLVITLAPSPATLGLQPAASFAFMAISMAAQIVLAIVLDRPLRLLRSFIERAISTGLAERPGSAGRLAPRSRCSA